MDHLYIKDLEIMAKHGVFPEEKALGQKFLVSVDCAYDMKTAAKDNALESSVHYGILCAEIHRLLTENTYDLIETCAYVIVEHIFSHYSYVCEVSVSIKKPFAPIGLPLRYPEVCITRKKRTAWIALGSNMGERKELLSEAIKAMQDAGLLVKKESSLYETKAWGKTDQPDFLNQVIEVETFEEPEDLLLLLQKIERNMGRVRHEHWGPRPIDLDILMIDSLVLYSDTLKVPHPYMEERAFVLDPLSEIAPYLIHPVLHQQIRQLQKALKEK